MDPVFDIEPKLGWNNRTTPMKEVHCWEGSDGILHRSKEEAAAHLVGCASSTIIKRMLNERICTDDPLIEALAFLADKFKPDRKSKRRAAR